MFPVDKDELFHHHIWIIGENNIYCQFCGIDKPKMVELTIEEIRTLYKLLEREYISYENTDALVLIKKIRNIVDDMA